MEAAARDVPSMREDDDMVTRYRTIVADPSWPLKYNGGGVRYGGTWRKTRTETKRSGLGYSTMTVDDICALGVDAIAETDAHLYLWIPDSLLIAGVAQQVCEAWGFATRGLLIWHKRNFGMGTFPRHQHEAIVCAKRGSLPYQIANQGSVHSWKVSYAPGIGKRHSEKPDGALDLIEQASPGPYLEMFARRNRLGWDTWGNEALEHVALVAPDAVSVGRREKRRS